MTGIIPANSGLLMEILIWNGLMLVFSRRVRNSCFPRWPIPSIPTQRSQFVPATLALFALWPLMTHLNIDSNHFSIIPQRMSRSVKSIYTQKLTFLHYLSELTSSHMKAACAHPQNVSAAERARRWSRVLSSSVSPLSTERLLKPAVTSAIITRNIRYEDGLANALPW